MKYQGFYDYSLDSSGKPDRTFTAQQFCMYMKALLGNGIGITEATGDNAWKVEKIGDLTARVTLGKNGYNFASLNGNPFIVDEELSFTFSQGTDRWDAVLIRANSTMEVRATDIIIQENGIAYTRSTDIYDLRIARVHIVDNVITEIIDDRLNIEYCGIADGLVTVPTDELEQLIKEVTVNGGVASILTFSNITLETTSWVEDATYEEFGFKAEVPCAGVTGDFFSDVVFGVAEAISGNYAPISLTGEGIVTIYAVEAPENTITIPSIICIKGASV